MSPIILRISMITSVALLKICSYSSIIRMCGDVKIHICRCNTKAVPSVSIFWHILQYKDVTGMKLVLKTYKIWNTVVFHALILPKCAVSKCVWVQLLFLCNFPRCLLYTWHFLTLRVVSVQVEFQYNSFWVRNFEELMHFITSMTCNMLVWEHIQFHFCNHTLMFSKLSITFHY